MNFKVKFVIFNLVFEVNSRVVRFWDFCHLPLIGIEWEIVAWMEVAGGWLITGKIEMDFSSDRAVRLELD